MPDSRIPPFLPFSKLWSFGVLISYWKQILACGHSFRSSFEPVRANEGGVGLKVGGGLSTWARLTGFVAQCWWLAPSCVCLFLLFIQIMIHVQSNMLKALIEILKDATEGNLSRFVKKHVFSEEVVSMDRDDRTEQGQSLNRPLSTLVP